jgi:hypothetical protein
LEDGSTRSAALPSNMISLALNEYLLDLSRLDLSGGFGTDMPCPDIIHESQTHLQPLPAKSNGRFWALNESLSACSYERRSVIALFLANHTPKVSYSFDLKNTGFQRQPTYFFRTTHVEE